MQQPGAGASFLKELTCCCDKLSWLISDEGVKGFSALLAK
jgi:hypothetical protein